MNKNLSFPWGEIGGKKPILHLYKTQKKKKKIQLTGATKQP